MTFVPFSVVFCSCATKIITIATIAAKTIISSTEIWAREDKRIKKELAPKTIKSYSSIDVCFHSFFCSEKRGKAFVFFNSDKIKEVFMSKTPSSEPKDSMNFSAT